MQTRDLYIAPADIGFWQAAIREAGDPDYAALSRDIQDMQPFTIDVLYGDHEGGQRTITRFGMIPLQTGDDVKVVPERGAPLEPGPARSRGQAGRAMPAGTGQGDSGRRPRSSASQRRS